MKSNVRVIMNAFLAGIPVEMDGRTYRLFKKGDEVDLPSFSGVADGYWLGVELQHEDGGKSYLGVDMSFTDMLELMDKVSEHDLILIAGSTVLTEIAKESRHG